MRETCKQGGRTKEEEDCERGGKLIYGQAAAKRQ